MATKTTKKRRSMTPEHKAALAEGRAQGRAVRAYLEALETNRPKRGRKRSPESMRNRVHAIDEALPDADPMTRLQLVQERLDLQRSLEAGESKVDMSALEESFVAAARSYAERKGISYTAFREVGVPASVLRRAGISRSA